MVRPVPEALRRLALIALALLAAAVWAAAAPVFASARPPARWVAVSVATLWVKPGLARPVDAPACASPADPRAWVASMTTTQKRWLVGKLETQALYGDKVYVLATSGAWSRVAVAGQPTPRGHWGYPGWLPTRQLTATAPIAAPRTAVVRRPTARLWRSSDLAGRVLQLSYGTRLQAVTWTPDAVEVVLLDGHHAFVRRADVALHAPGAPWPALTGAKLVAEAKRFLGVQYLWAGTSGFGFDCSGFTYSVYRALGVTIPRDGAPQAEVGRRVASRGALRPGDLVFFRVAPSAIHHVGLYVGDGRMIHAPATGLPVAIVSILAEPYAGEFAGGRRFTP